MAAAVTVEAVALVPVLVAVTVAAREDRLPVAVIQVAVAVADIQSDAGMIEAAHRTAGPHARLSVKRVRLTAGANAMMTLSLLLCADLSITMPAPQTPRFPPSIHVCHPSHAYLSFCLAMAACDGDVGSALRGRRARLRGGHVPHRVSEHVGSIKVACLQSRIDPHPPRILSHSPPPQ